MSNLPAAPTAYICINGILTNPGDAEGWTDRAVTWLNLHTPGKAEKFEYAAGPLTRRLRQDWRAQAIARMAGFYITAGYEVQLIAHSNGGDLTERVLDLLWPAQIQAAHLFAPACDGKRLAHALEVGQLGHLALYGSPNDLALRGAAVSGRLLRWIGLGYGDLGRRVAAFAAEHPRTVAHEDPTKGHGTWFARGENFERTMRLIVGHPVSS